MSNINEIEFGEVFNIQDKHAVPNKSQAVQSLHIESGKIKPTAMIGNTTQVIDEIDENNGIIIEVINDHTDQILGNAERCNDLNDKIDQEVSQLNDDLVQTNEVVSQLNENLSDLAYSDYAGGNAIIPDDGTIIRYPLKVGDVISVNNSSDKNINIEQFNSIGGSRVDFWSSSSLSKRTITIVKDSEYVKISSNIKGHFMANKGSEFLPYEPYIPSVKMLYDMIKSLMPSATTLDEE